MPSKANTSKNSREDKLYLLNQANNDDEWVDPSDLSTPRLIALYDERDRLYKEEIERKKRLRKIAQRIKAEEQAMTQAMTQARVKSADDFERRYKRDREHEELSNRERRLEAKEKHFKACHSKY